MAAPNVIFDWQDDWSGGVNAAVSAKRLLLNQAHSAKNTSFRGGQPHPRPAVEMRGALNSGILQGWCYYNTPEADYIVAVIAGRVYVLEPTSTGIDVTDVTPGDGGNGANDTICYLCHADKYVIIQDGQRVPIVVSGKTAKRADGKNPIPIGTVMAYVNGRLWVAIKDQVLAGDLIGSEEDAVLKFSEAQYLNEGGSFKSPVSFGDVVSMGATVSQDSATGQGPLQVECEGGIFTINSLIPREQWKTTPIQQIALIGIGSTGQRSTVNVNGDRWFRSHDGWRSIRQARAEIGGWNHVPLSEEVGQYIRTDTQAFLPYVSAVYFDNRLLVTSGPINNNNRPYNAGMLALDFHPISTGLGTSSRPVWEGYWELPFAVVGLVTGTFDGVKRCLALCWSGTQNLVYEFTDGYADSNAAISWELVTRKFPFGSAADGNERKLVAGGDFGVSNRIGETTASLSWRQDDSCQWKFWQTFGESGRTGHCSAVPVDGVCSLTVQPCAYTPKELLGEPAETYDPVTRRDDARFYNSQFKFNMTGWMQLEHFRPAAARIGDSDQHGDPKN